MCQPVFCYDEFKDIHSRFHLKQMEKFLPVNIPPIIAQTPVKKCIKDLEKNQTSYYSLLNHCNMTIPNKLN